MLPFVFEPANNFDENGNINDTYLTIQIGDLSFNHPDWLSMIEYTNKKIISINGKDPFQFIGEYATNIKYHYCHSLQCNYIRAVNDIASINLY